ncbi:NUDIX domain-containing protein [Lacinutrix sp. Hel_I_90]|uniref:NUDIX domain-containing protein n=1 Tax=Lacinutrix sp. Hel_I_90 TaxID=1249999 RepID=UPI0005C88381|nr:NUDIX domain-containing protein [Lacinutrix sp. Hel_I_90]
MSNNRIKNLKSELLSKYRYTLSKLTFDYHLNNGEWVTQIRECYARGNGAVILLYNIEKQTVVLTRQLRIPSYMNGNTSGLLIEACAGLLDGDNPEDCIKKETEEETGYRLTEVKKVLEAYSSPGVLTEVLHYFIAEYSADMKVSKGGGAENETEDIEVLEMPFKEAIELMSNGNIKDLKTICLLQYAQINNIFKN